MLQVHTYQTPPSSESKTTTSKSPTASPVNQTPQGRSSSNNNSTIRQEQKSSQSRTGNSSGHRGGNNKNNNDGEDDEDSWVLVAQQQDEMDKIISALSPSQIMARPLRTPNQRSAATKNKVENEDEPQQEELKLTQENSEWNWKEARKGLSKIKQRLIVKLFPIQKPKQKHYKHFMIQPVSTNNEAVDFPIEQFVDESPLKQFVDCQPDETPSFDPKSFPSELGTFVGSMNPQKVPDPDDFILQKLPPKLEIPSNSPEEEIIPPTELTSAVDQINPQIVVRNSNELVPPQQISSNAPSHVDLQEMKAEIEVLEHQLGRRNVVLNRLSVRRISDLKIMLEKKQKQFAVLSHRLRMTMQNQSSVASSSSTNEPKSVVTSSIHAADQPKQQELQQSPTTTTIENETIRLERVLDQRKRNVAKLQNHLLLLKRIQHRHKLIGKLKANLVGASRQ